jgi:hypothetical protein
MPGNSETADAFHSVWSDNFLYKLGTTMNSIVAHETEGYSREQGNMGKSE